MITDESIYPISSKITTTKLRITRILAKLSSRTERRNLIRSGSRDS